jgi:DNA-directed RNA polymerase subunit beta'
VLGSYYLTLEPRRRPADGERIPLFGSVNEVMLAEADGVVKKHQWIRMPNPDYGREGTVYGKADKKILVTTPGRVIFSTIWPKELGFVNFSVAKKKLGELILNTYKKTGKENTVAILDLLKELGFRTATKAGISIGIADMIIPPEKAEIVARARARLKDVINQYNRGIITSGERYNKVIDIWTTPPTRSPRPSSRASTTTRSRRVKPVYLMMDSGARGNRQQVRQLCGTRGLMAKPSGEIIERPSSRRSARACRCWSTSTPPTAPARALPTRRSRPPTPAT